jgi:molybdate transport system substrate-binding protein
MEEVMANLPAIRTTLKIAAFAGLALVATAQDARAADIIFLSANALRPALQELIPEFQNASGHNVSVSYATLGVVTDRIRKGDEADLASVSPAQWESLQKENKLSPDASVVIAKGGLGVFVKKGAARPDISSVDTFKTALLNARSIVTGDPAQGSPVGAYIVPLFDRLGISADIKPKLQLTAGGPATMQPVVKGDAELGINQMSEIITLPDVDLVGPLPAAIQNFTVYTAAIPASAKQTEAVKALVEFLTSPQARSVFQSKGFEPG